MKKILKKYITALREKRLEGIKKELVKQLLRIKNPDGKTLGDIVLNNRTYVRELIMENLPDDATDDELYVKSHLIRDELYFMKEEEEIKAGNMSPESCGCYSPLTGNITDGSHEGW